MEVSSTGAGTVDPKRISRLSSNLAELLTDLIRSMEEVAKKSEPKRKRILADLEGLLALLDERDQGLVLSRLRHDVQRALDERGSPKITVTGGDQGCVGRPGGSVNATEGNVTVGVCAVVSGVKPIGGGVQGTVRY